MKRLLLAALAAACVSGCAATYDPLQTYKVPEECTSDALAAIKLSVIEVPKLSYREHGHSVGAYGMWDDRSSTHVILIVRGLPEPLRSEVLAHERCHELMWLLTGNAFWHG